jgi:hypothetical protein
MAVSKPVMYAFGLLIIGSFLIGMMWPIMTSNNQNTPSPTPQQNTDFEGQGTATATISELLNDYLIECNASNAKQLVSEVEGVGLAFTVAPGLYAATGENVSAALYEALEGECEPDIYRSAKLEYDSALQIDANTTIPAYVIEQLTAYVGAFHEEGDEVLVNVLIQVQNGQVVNAQVFEMPETMPALPETTPAEPVNQTVNGTETNQTNESE